MKRTTKKITEARPLQLNEQIPHVTKYMGSKRNLIDFIVSSLNEVYTGKETIVDLFAGSSILSGALRNQAEIHSNDIQSYSAVLASLYLSNYDWISYNGIADHVVDQASEIFETYKKSNNLKFDYSKINSIDALARVESKQRNLYKKDFANQDYHLFTKYYSGTYWNYEQCLWIDSIRKVADEYKNTNLYFVILASLMFAMTYNSQSTGHYAQYRDATSKSSMKDILIYRQREFLPYFKRKFADLKVTLNENKYSFKTSTLDYSECLNDIDKKSIVYADPPYCFVHYSRFYHALETLVKYDYPEVQHKGRYRTDRHQSPFCIKTKVEGAFIDMFQKIKEKESSLVLSYSDTGMIDLESLKTLMRKQLGKGYDFETRVLSYQHSTMGRKEDKSRDVEEATLIAKKA